MNFRQKLKQSKILKALASLKITVTCLLLLFVLTFWGTVGQVQHGLYLAQERYFYSFFFFVFGFIPFPGAQLVMWVMFVNLTCVTLIRFVYSLKHIGILIIHGGLLLFLISGYITLHAAQDSYLTLREGQGANVSSAFHTWELAVWEASDKKTPITKRQITAADIQNFKAGQPVKFDDLGFQITLKQYWRNAAAYLGRDARHQWINASGIGRLEAKSLEKEPEKNTPGVILSVTTDDKTNADLLLYGSETTPTKITMRGKTYNFLLRLKRFPLPFTLKLIDFMMEKHPGTETARSFKSRVEIETNGVWREKLISMNNPLRYKEFTFYQSSYSIDTLGREASTLAVVRNSGRLMPYIATFVTFLGLVIHFVMMAFNNSRKIKSA